MFSPEAMQAALDQPEGLADVTKIEFELLDNGTPRWLLWDGPKLLYSCTLDREELVVALQMSGMLLRTMTLSFQEDRCHGRPTC